MSILCVPNINLASVENTYPAWEARYDNGGTGNHRASSVAIDPSGDLVVVGVSNNPSVSANEVAIVKFRSTDGSKVWEVRNPQSRNAVSVKANGIGDLFVLTETHSAGTASSDFHTAKYAGTTGALIWQQQFNGAASQSDSPAGLVLDPAGNVIVAGSTYKVNGRPDFHVIKYSAVDGAVSWSVSAPGISEEARAVAVDASGNVFVTGYSIESGQGRNFYTVKLAAANGALIWEQRFNGPNNGSEEAYGLAVDPLGDVIVIGYFSTGQDCIAKYRGSDGLVLWERSEPQRLPRAITTNSAADVFVVGGGRQGRLAGTFMIERLASDTGDVIWKQVVTGPANYEDEALAVATDPVGNPVVTGRLCTFTKDTSFFDPDDGFDFETEPFFDTFTAKYASSDGTLIWSHQSGIRTRNEESSAIAIGVDGTVAIAGYDSDARRFDPEESDFYIDTNMLAVRLVSSPKPTLVVSSATPAAGAGLPADTRFVAFGSPDVGVSGGVVRTPDGERLTAAFSQTGDVILRAKQAMIVVPDGPQETIARVGQPSGDAVIVKLRPSATTRASNDEVLFLGLSSGNPVPIAREGDEIPGVPGVFLKKFGNLDANGSITFFTGKLRGTGVNAKNDDALFASAVAGGFRVLVREGMQVGDRTIQTIGTLVGQAGTLAEGRWRGATNQIGVRLTLTGPGKVQALYLVPANAMGAQDWILLGQSGDSAGPDLAGAELASFNLPAHSPGATVFDSLLKIGPGGITRKDNRVVLDAIGIGGVGPITLRRLAQLAGPVPANNGVLINGSGLQRLLSTLSGASSSSTVIGRSTLGRRDAPALTIYDSRNDGQLRQVARIGARAPGGGRWQKFKSVAKPDGANSGVLISALLAVNSNERVTPKNRAVLHAMDSKGELRRLLRTGDMLESAGAGSPVKKVKSFVALEAAPGSIGSARGHNETGKVSALVTFTDRTQSVVAFQVP